MRHLDVSLKETSVCILDETGAVLREPKFPAILKNLTRIVRDLAMPLVRTGPEAAPLAQWLFGGMVVTRLPAICIETHHTKAFLKAQINKTDRNDRADARQFDSPCSR
jgi:transposase